MNSQSNILRYKYTPGQIYFAFYKMNELQINLTLSIPGWRPKLCFRLLRVNLKGL